MGENIKGYNLGEGTFENISREDFFINQNNEVDSFGKCPGCDNETLDLKIRECECGYSLNHDLAENIEDYIDETIEKTTKTLNYRICSCGKNMGIKSIMCKDCYWKNKLNGNI